MRRRDFCERHQRRQGRATAAIHGECSIGIKPDVRVEAGKPDREIPNG